jgi:hypothetical protein
VVLALLNVPPQARRRLRTLQFADDVFKVSLMKSAFSHWIVTKP